MHNSLKNLNQQRGITGLETAIILIAFVIVASVLSYVVISAGLFSSQKAKVAVNKGLEQTGSTIELKGNVTAELLGVDDPDRDTVIAINFTIGVVPGGSAIDLSPNAPPEGDEETIPPPLIISYSDSSQQVPSLYWEVKQINYNNGDYMLDPGELVTITVYLDDNGGGYYSDEDDSVHYMPNPLVAGTTFCLSVIPPDGSVLPIERTIPSGVRATTDDTALVNLN